jgi:hypothetical protein
MPLLTFLFWLLVIAIVVGGIHKLGWISQPFLTIFDVVVLIAVLFWVANTFGLLTGGPWIGTHPRR